MKSRNGFKVMAKLIGLVKPLTGYMIVAISMGLIGHLCAAFLTIFGGICVLNLLGFETVLPLNAVFICLILFAVFRGILRYVEQACNHFIAFKLLALIRKKVFSALRRLCPAKLEGKDRGNLISVITSDIELLEVFYAHTISPICIAALFSIVLCIYIGSYYWTLGMIAFAAYVTIGIIIPMVISKMSGDMGLKFRNYSGELSGFVLDNLRGLNEILQYHGGEKRLAEMNEGTDRLSVVEEKMKKISGRNTAITNTAVLVFDFLIIFASAYLYTRGEIAFDGVLIPVIALMSSFGPVMALANLGSTLQNTFAAGNRVLDILEETPVVGEVTGEKEIEFSGAKVKNVTFSYKEETILKNLSLEIPANQIIGITGRSGSGKSTLLRLLMRFFEPQGGEVCISDRNVSCINTSNLREMESFVTQQTHLFHDSIRNNLKIAKWDATEEEIKAACRKASIHDFIMTLPKGYDTPVGELGDTLSGGERQRIGIARAFLHDAPFLLLDEPTSNLDSLNEAVILKSLYEEGEGKTVILVAHRKSTMKIADRVYSVECGRVS